MNGAEVMFFICSLFSAPSSPSSLQHVLSLRPPHPFQSLPLSTTTHPLGAATWHAMELNRDEGEVVVRRALQESKIVCFYFCHLRFTTGSSTLRRRRQRVALPWQWSVALTNLQDVPLNVALVAKSFGALGEEWQAWNGGSQSIVFIIWLALLRLVAAWLALDSLWINFTVVMAARRPPLQPTKKWLSEPLLKAPIHSKRN